MKKLSNVRVSKFFSYVLRHAPETIDLQLDRNGWAEVDELLSCAEISGKTISFVQLQEVVATDDKSRFTLTDDGKRIRANQGHSLDIDLALDALAPPSTLYHGTATRFLDSIIEQGLHPRNRHHVHLSIDTAAAIKVGQRHGTPTVLEIDAERMSRDGHEFYCSANGVWLTSTVPPGYFLVIDHQNG